MKRILLIAVAILAGIAAVTAQNKKEVSQLRQFLQQTSAHGDANYIRLRLSLNNPASWSGVVWGSDGRVVSIEWGDKKLAGSINLSGFTSLKKVDLCRNKIDSVNLAGCTSLQYLMEEGKLDLGKYVEMTTNIDNIMDAFAAIRDKNIMKVVVHPQE